MPRKQKSKTKIREAKHFQRFPIHPTEGIVPVADTPYDAIPLDVKNRLIEAIEKNRTLPPALQKSKFALLIDAGFPYDKAIQLSNLLFENGKVKHEIRHRGFDADSAKLTMQEIMHDERNTAEVRLKAATETLKVLDEYKGKNEGDSTSQILAGLLRDIFDANKNRSVKPTRVIVQEPKSLQ